MSFFAEGGFFKQFTYHISKLQSGAIYNYAVMMLTGLTLYVVLHEDLVNNDRDLGIAELRSCLLVGLLWVPKACACGSGR